MSFEGMTKREALEALAVAQARIAELEVLHGATEEPAPNVLVGSPGEFAARWNRWSSEDRERVTRTLVEQSAAAVRCFVEDHNGMKARHDARVAELAALVGEARSAFVPSTEQVRRAVEVYACGVEGAGEAFDRWHRDGLGRAWWEGVNAQWKHRPIGNRLIEFANPYREGSGG